MITRLFKFFVLSVAAAALLCGVPTVHAHGLQVLLDTDGSGGLSATYGSGAHPLVTGVQIGDALLWDERARNVPGYPSDTPANPGAFAEGQDPGTLDVGRSLEITAEDGTRYLIEYDSAEWDNQLEWRLEPHSTDFPGVTPLRGGFEAIEAHYGGAKIDMRYNLQGPLLKWDGVAFAPATAASVSLTSQDWPTPTDGVLYEGGFKSYWYAELDQKVTSSDGVVASPVYDVTGEDFDGGEHWHYLWTLNGADDQTPADDGVYLVEYTVSSGDGLLESNPMWLLLRNGDSFGPNSPTYLAAQASVVASIPEPTTLALATLGLAVLAVPAAGTRRQGA